MISDFLYKMLNLYFKAGSRLGVVPYEWDRNTLLLRRPLNFQSKLKRMKLNLALFTIHILICSLYNTFRFTYDEKSPILLNLTLVSSCITLMIWILCANNLVNERESLQAFNGVIIFLRHTNSK